MNINIIIHVVGICY